MGSKSWQKATFDRKIAQKAFRMGEKDFRMIMSSDESKFNLFGTNRRIEEFALEEPLSKVAAE